MGFSQTPELALYVTGLVCNCFGSPGLPFMLHHLCALVSALQARPLCLGACVFFLWLPRPTLCTGRVVCTAEVCMPWLSWQPRPAI